MNLLVFQDWPTQSFTQLHLGRTCCTGHYCVPWGDRINEPRFSEPNGKDGHMWTETVQGNTNRELIKVQTECCRNPEKGIINFDQEGRWHSWDLKGKESAKCRVSRECSIQRPSNLGNATYEEEYALLFLAHGYTGPVPENEAWVKDWHQSVTDLTCYDKFGWALYRWTGKKVISKMCLF